MRCNCRLDRVSPYQNIHAALTGGALAGLRSDAMSAAARLTANNLRRDKLRPGWVIRLSSNPRRGPRAKFRLFFGHDSTCRLSRSYVEFGVSCAFHAIRAFADT